MHDFFYYKYRLSNLYYRIKGKFFYRFLFEKFGNRSKIIKPLILKNTKMIVIGDRVTISNGVFMDVEENDHDKRKARLIIGDGTTLGNYNHIVALNEVIIEEDVLTADRVYISDNYHDYENTRLPVCKQEVKSKGPTKIGEGSWLGENVCVMSANIGKHCVVAANSVVINDIPDYCVVAGAPAKIKKQYNFKTGKWEKNII